MTHSLQNLARTSITEMGIAILADSATKACVILLMAALLVCALRRSSAAIRHLTWVVALLAVLLVPLLSAVIPQYRVLPSWLATAQLVADHQQRDAESEMDEEMMLSLLGDGGVEPRLDDSDSVGTSTIDVEASGVAFVRSSVAVKNAIFTVWAIGAVVMLLRIVLSWLVLRRLQRSAAPVCSGRLCEMLGETTRTLRVRRSIHVYTTPWRSIPMAWGILRTCLALPDEAKHWDSRRLRSVLLHELGHAKRRDMLTHVFTQIVCSVYWFHPLVWLASWRVHTDRERACDDLVVASGVRPSEYAGHLLEIIAGFRSSQMVPCAALAMAKPSLLEGRVMAILNERICRKPLTGGRFAISLFIGITGTTAVAMLQAKPLVAEPQNARVSATEEPANGVSAQDRDVSSDKDIDVIDAQSHTTQLVSSTNARDSVADEAERDAEAALKDAGATVERDDSEQVVAVRLRDKPEFSDRDVTHLAKLNWSKNPVSRPGPRGWVVHYPILDLRNSQVTDVGLRQITKLAPFATLSLRGSKITDEGIADLKRLSGLKSLDLSETMLTDVGLAHLEGLVELEDLSLKLTAISDAGLAKLNALRNLQLLRLTGTRITDASVARLKEWYPNLRGLWLSETQVTNDGLKHLQAFPNLELLIIRQTEITDAGLEHLKPLIKLRVLWLNETDVTDDGLAHLTGLNDLYALWLNDTSITDAGLVHLTNLNNLHFLYLHGTDLSDEAVGKLREALPDCTIEFP